jgi:hypothetical protein
MFKIVHLDGKQELPTDDIYYIIAKGGIYLKKKTGLIESLTPVKNISILESVIPYAKINIPKISGKDFWQVMTFFKKVYEEYHSEAIVMLYYNSNEKKFKVHVPYQKVSSARLDYIKSTSIKGYNQIGTIHSHAGFSAFHSSVDDSDEECFDGIHMTIGNNDDDFPSISASIVVNGHRVTIDPINYVEDLELTEYTPYFSNMFRPTFLTINGEKEYTKNVKSKTGYRLNVKDQDKKFLDKWMKLVEGTKVRKNEFWGNTKNKYTWGDYNHNYGYNNSDWFRELLGTERDFKSITGKSSTKLFPSKYDPCSDCAFKSHKSNKEKLPKSCKNKKLINEEEDKQEGFDCLESVYFLTDEFFEE